MTGVAEGFTVIFIVIGIGYLLGRTEVLGAAADQVLSRLMFFVATPALLFDSLAHADISVMFSSNIIVAGLSAFTVGALYFLLAKVWLKREIPEAAIGALASSYVNSANLGIPIAIYVLGDATLVAPLLLFQILIYSPIALTILDLTALENRSRPSVWSTITTPFKNPIVIAGATGLGIAISSWSPPDAIMQPFHLIGGISVPGALLTFGLSLHGIAILQKGTSPRRDILLATVLKIVAQPIIAFFLARQIFGESGHALFVSIVIATLPTAQNVFIYASRYQRGVVLARDTALISTLASIPAIMLVAAIFA
ncbi:MAG: AEC family transporter [Mycobacteriaceae bacterium]